ncbi:MAG: threonine dehydratase [Aeromicrobium sp.]
MSVYGLTLDQLDDAAKLVHEFVPPTPQHRWPLIDEALGTETWLKHENHTSLGAFKIRGGIVYMHRLMEREKPSGLVTATRGNHGQAIGAAARRHGVPLTIVVPHGNSREKNEAMRAQGATLLEVGDDFQESFEHATALAEEHGWHQVANFHRDLLEGVASYPLELFRAVPDLDVVYVPIGLGSGICATVAARDALGLTTRVVGVVSAGAPAYARSWEAGEPVSVPVTTKLADGMACRTPVPEALEIIRSTVDHLVEVDDDQVAAAMSLLFTATHNVAEGAGAAALAAAMHERGTLAGQRVGVMVTGGNVDRDVFARTLA